MINACFENLSLQTMPTVNANETFQFTKQTYTEDKSDKKI